MARIGLAYNQKPDEPALHDDAEAGVTPAVDRYAEWDTPATIDAVAAALAAYGTVVRLEATDEFPERLRAERPDIVFNIAEGLLGPSREAHVPAICEFLGVPYTASDPLTCALALHKGRTKELLAQQGVPTAPFVVVSDLAVLQGLARFTSSEVGRPSPENPLFLKPVHEGSSKGISERNLVRSPAALLEVGAALLREYEQPVLVERYLPGAEFTCGILGNGADAEVLPIVAMNFGVLPAGALPIYGYEAKWVWDTPDRPLAMFECPARLPGNLRRAIEGSALAAFHALGCRDWARVDVRLDADGEPHVVEVNPLPGILPDPADNSCLPKAARAAGLSYDALIQRCLLEGARRQGVGLRRVDHAQQSLPLASSRGSATLEATA